MKKILGVLMCLPFVLVCCIPVCLITVLFIKVFTDDPFWVVVKKFAEVGFCFVVLFFIIGFIVYLFEHGKKLLKK